MSDAEQVIVDQMAAEDLDAVLEIERRSFEDPWPAEVFRAELRHCWSHCRVLRRPDVDPHADRKAEAVIGYLIFWSVADEVHLLNVAVLPEERHHHYGRQLMDHLRAFAETNEARFITLEVRSSNTPAITLYESIGFKVVGVRPKYYANNAEDAIVMLCDVGSSSGVRPLPAAPATPPDA